MKRKYLIGKDKFTSDVFWCAIISFFVTLYVRKPSFFHNVGYMIGTFSWVFLFLFFWSWNKNDAQSMRARLLIKSTCLLWFFSAVFLIFWTLQLIATSGISLESCWIILSTFVITFLIAKKYRSVI